MSRKRYRQPPHVAGPDCHCPTCRRQRAWATGQYAGRRKPVRGDVWKAAHDRLLRQLVGQLAPQEIAARLTAAFPGTPRTETAVVIRCKRLGLSPTLVHHNARSVGALFGVDGKTVTESWIARGQLEGTQQHPGQAGSSWIITDVALEAFIRHYPHVYDWRAMRPGPWRTLAELVWRQDPLLTVEEAASIVGLTPKTIARFLREGHLVGVRHFRKPGPWAGQWLIRRSTLRAFRPPDADGRAGFTLITRAEARALIARWGRERGYAANAGRRRRQQGAA